jgi:methyl-accepting chemotaxis protein
VLRNILLDDTEEANAGYIKNIQDYRTEIDKLADMYEKLIVSDRGVNFFKAFKDAQAEYTPAADRVVELAINDKNRAGALAFLRSSDYTTPQAKYQKSIDDQIAYKQDIANQTNTTDQAMGNTAQLITIATLIVSAILSLALGFSISRSISRQLGTEPSTMMEIAQRISQGDLTINFERRNGTNATGAFASLKDMSVKAEGDGAGGAGERGAGCLLQRGDLNNVSEMSHSISAATEEQTTNAKQVSKAVENVNELTQSAAFSAEEMSSATEQLSGMAQELQRLMSQFKITDGDGGLGKQLQRAVAGNGHGNGNGNGNGKAAARKEQPRALPVQPSASA